MESRMARDINQLEAEGLVTIAEDSEGVDFLFVQEWVEGLNMATHMVIWDVGDPGWVRRTRLYHAFQCSLAGLTCCFIAFNSTVTM